MVTALRSLLRFLFVTGRIDRELAAAVPTVANRKLSTLPGRLLAGEASLLLGSCDRDTPGRPPRLRDPHGAGPAGAARM